MIIKDGLLLDLKDWSYEKVLPYFKKIETWSEGENDYRGGNGILPVNQSKNKNPLFQAFIRLCGGSWIQNK